MLERRRRAASAVRAYVYDAGASDGSMACRSSGRWPLVVLLVSTLSSSACAAHIRATARARAAPGSPGNAGVVVVPSVPTTSPPVAPVAPAARAPSPIYGASTDSVDGRSVQSDDGTATVRQMGGAGADATRVGASGSVHGSLEKTDASASHTSIASNGTGVAVAADKAQAQVGVSWWKHTDIWNAWASEDSAAMFGYTDCSSQSPPLGSLAKQQEWWVAHSGFHKPAPGSETCTTCEGPIRVPVVPGIAMCTVPKNGCTYWKALFMRMGGNPLWNSTEIMDVHYKSTNKLNYDSAVLGMPGGLVLMTVRNPVARTLSAWLDKRQDPLYLSWFRNNPGTTMSFVKFVEAIAPSVTSHQADPHWSLQSDLCLQNYGAVYDVYLKVECRTLWAPSLFDFKNMHAWTDSGWGPTGQDPFVRDDRLAMKRAMTSDTNVGVAPATMSKASKTRGHNTGSSGMDKLCKYYTSELFHHVATLYQADIAKFGYTEDVQRIANHCGF